MSKWIKKEDFKKFRDERKADVKKERNDFEDKWPNPEQGTSDRPNVYELRFLPDKNGNFYKKYSYHMIKTGESWYFTVCPKTFDMDNYCPICAVTGKLYKSGSDADKETAKDLKRKDRFVVNTLIVKDPRDEDRDSDKKLVGQVLKYEFPGKLENQIKEAIEDDENGVGIGAFDPETGFNFVLKVGASKPDANGKAWADYSLSGFSRKPSPIADSDEEIEEILNKTSNLDEYIKRSLRTNEEHAKALKSIFLFELIEDEYSRMIGVSEKSLNDEDSSEKETPREKKKEESNRKSSSEEVKTPSKKEESKSISATDEELLAELDAI